MTSTQEFVPISEKAVLTLLRNRYGYTTEGHADARRKTPRWPFPGTVELWAPADGEQQGEEHILARALNLSPGGVGLLVDVPLAVDLELPLAIHEPEITFYGRGKVRHCSESHGAYHVGVEFVF